LQGAYSSRVRGGWIGGNIPSPVLLVLGPLLQVQGRLEKQKLGLSKRGLLGDGSEPLGMLVIFPRLSGHRVSSLSARPVRE
jgi:hypothetical protein